MPDHLIDIPRPTTLSPGTLKQKATPEEVKAHNRRAKKIDDFHNLISERETWAFRRVANANKRGDERWQCPAQAGKRICEHCPMSELLPEETPRVDGPPAAQTRPKACRQSTITIPAAAHAKLRQRLYWGSPEWVASYNRRTYVEGFFGTLKSGSKMTRDWCRVVGLVKTSLLAACAAAATNIKLLRAWATRTRDFTHPLAEPAATTAGFIELPSPDDEPLAQGPPPTA